MGIHHIGRAVFGADGAAIQLEDHRTLAAWIIDRLQIVDARLKFRRQHKITAFERPDTLVGFGIHQPESNVTGLDGLGHRQIEGVAHGVFVLVEGKDRDGINPSREP